MISTTAPADPRHEFPPGTEVAGRYRVVRLLGAGGGGEVYEVEDLELREPVALKTLRFEKPGDAAARERFRREITLARRVSHPNICRTFDFGTHRRPDGVEETFLTMELVRGTTLSGFLGLRGRLTPDELLPILRQLVAGLAAAHDAGVVHRDFKSPNVILESPALAGDTPRAVITDFGLARLQEGGETTHAASVTVAGMIVGSPAYMAPEQIRSGEVSQRSDIYSLGVVMYEALTGELPFAGEVLETALQKLTLEAPSAATLVPDLDPLWESVVARCLARDPQARFADVREVLSALHQAANGWPAKISTVWLVPVAAVLLAGAIAVATLSRRPSIASSPQAPASRTSVAVLSLANLAHEPSAAWIPKAVAEMLVSELSAGGALRVLPGETTARMKRDLRLGESATLAPDTLKRIRRYLGSDVVIAGSCLAVGAAGNRHIRLDLTLQNARSGETYPPVIVEGTESNLIELVARGGNELRSRLGMKEVSPADLVAVRSAMPALPVAQLYALGIEQLRQANPLAGKALLERAVATRADYPLAHAALASAWSALGYDSRAASEAQKAFELSSGLPLADRLSIEGAFGAATRDWERAVQALASLRSLFPDDLDHGLRLAQARTGAGQHAEALAVVASLRQLPSPANEDPRIDLAEAEAALGESDFARAANAAARAAEKGTAREQHQLVAQARLREAWAQRNLGELDRAQAAAAAARSLYEAAGQEDGAARALMMSAVLLRNRGDLAGAHRLDEEALEVFRRVGNQAQMAMALNNLGKGSLLNGSLTEAAKYIEESLAICRQIEDAEGIARQVNNLAEVKLAAGDALGAERLFRDAMLRCSESSDRRLCADIFRGLADSHLAQGKLGSAAAHYRSSAELARKIGQRRYEAFATNGLGLTALEQDDAAAARREMQAALDLRIALGERSSAAESELGLAELALESGDLDAAGRHALSAQRALGAGQRDRRVQALALRIRAALRQDGIQSVEKLLPELRAAVQLSEDPRVRLAALTVEVELAGDASTAARRALQSDLAQLSETARTGGLTLASIGAEILAARLQAPLDRAAAQRSLAAIGQRAEQLGLKRLARSARSPLSPAPG
jgi:serine/threonine protein kinase